MCVYISLIYIFFSLYIVVRSFKKHYFEDKNPMHIAAIKSLERYDYMRLEKLRNQ